jgi:hypothetical protein
MEAQHPTDYGCRTASYLRILGWINIIGWNLGGLLWLWFASKLRQKNNGFRKATIVLLGLHVIAGAVIILATVLKPNDSHVVIFGEPVAYAAPPISVLFGFAFIAIHLIPMLWLMSNGTRAAFERRSERGLCPTCGYDLRASAQQCPECGTSVICRVSPVV